MITSLTEDEKVDNFLDDGNALVLTMNLESRSDGDIRIHLNNLPTPGEQDAADAATHVDDSSDDGEFDGEELVAECAD